MNYYNEHDPKAAAWLRELVAAGLIPDGEVDERSICDVRSGDLRGFTQIHLFAGVAGWSLALQLAGWPPDRSAWTCSCPCQPFSCAGKGEAQSDSRHLWPHAFRLIRECRPDTIFGEQVKAAIGFGWLDGISADLESASYACRATVLGAHSVGAPHIRQRLYWVAQSQGQGRPGVESERATGLIVGARPGGGGPTDNRGGLAQSLSAGLEGHPRNEHDRNEPGRDGAHAAGPVAQGGAVGGVGNSAGDDERRERKSGEGSGRNGEAGGSSAGLGGVGIPQRDGRRAVRDDHTGHDGDQLDATCNNGFWSAFDLIPCRDGKTRRIPVAQSGIFPLVDGFPRGLVPSGDPGPPEANQTGEARVMRLKGYGNAINPVLAAEFIRAAREII